MSLPIRIGKLSYQYFAGRILARVRCDRAWCDQWMLLGAPRRRRWRPCPASPGPRPPPVSRGVLTGLQLLEAYVERVAKKDIGMMSYFANYH